MPSGHHVVSRPVSLRLVVGVVAVALVVPVVILAPVSPASAATPQFRPPEFGLASSGTDLPTSMTNFVYLPSGRIIAIGKQGDITQGVFGQEPWQVVTVNFLNSINSDVDRGLTGIDLDVNYATNGVVYLLYSYNKPNCAPAETGSAIPNTCGRLSKFHVDDIAAPTVLFNETPILDGLPAFSAYGVANDQSHTVGTVIVAPDGTLFVGNGDASSFDPRPAAYDPTSFFAQSIDSYRGKIFHIDSNGNGLASNPFYNGDPSAVRSKVFAYGLRNPFRFSLKPGTGVNGVAAVLYIGDVGSGLYEEVDVARGGENFGWPCYEGPITNRNEFAGDPFCVNQYSQNGAGVTFPIYTYLHPNTGTGNAIIGGTFAGGNYGSVSGSYFFGDAPYGAIWTLRTDANDGLVSAPAGLDDWFEGPPNTTNSPPDGGVGIPVAFHMAPDGNLQYAELNSSRIFEIQHCTSNCPPVAIATVTPTAGPPGTTFTFDGTQSYSPEGRPLQWSWDFGDGSGPQSGAVVTHTNGGRSNFTATLTVSDGVQSSTTKVIWSTLHAPPAITITPNKPGAYAVGETATMTADATGFDTSDQPYALTGGNIKWGLVIHHCPNGIANGCHIHPSTPTPTPTGNTYSTIAPDHGDYAYLQFTATATDNDGLTTTASFNLPMDFHSVFLSSNQPGVSLTVNGHPMNLPGAATAITNSNNRLTAPPSANGQPFAGWSDGDPNATKNFVMPAGDLALAACYGGPCSPVNATAPGLFSPVTPYRLFDTRTTDSPVEPGQTLEVDVSGQPGPPNRTAVLLNVTTDQPADAGYVQAFPCGQTPNTSTVNYDAGQTAANLAMVKLPANGHVCFTSFVPTHLIVDVAGWFSPQTQATGDGYVTVTPNRVLDTRLSGQKLPAGQELRLGLAGHAGFPDNATAALLNLTATEPDGPGYIKVYPCGQENLTSNVNYVASQTVANLAAVKVAPGGDVCFKSFATTHLVVDLAGWYVPGATGAFSATDPVRQFDTRQGAPVARLVAGQEVAIQEAGTALVPVGATSIALNVTVTHPDGPGYVKVYPCDSADPLVSNVNYRAGQEAAANLAVVRLPADGRVCFKSFASTDIVVDLAGWYTG